MSIKSIRLREARNRPPADEPWVWFTREMLESEAWSSLSRAARRVIDRVIIEHMAHAGTENGNLAVTYSDFVKYGIRLKSLKTAISEAAAKGFIIITQKGKASVGPDRWPTRYALGWLPLTDGAPALNRWKGWRRSRPSGPIAGNIDSTGDSARRENGSNPRPLEAEKPLAPMGENAPGESRKSTSA
jgi:hypothetical protein